MDEDEHRGGPTMAMELQAAGRKNLSYPGTCILEHKAVGEAEGPIRPESSVHLG